MYIFLLWSLHAIGANPSAPGKRLRNKSTIEATTLNPKPVESPREKEEEKKEEKKDKEKEEGEEEKKSEGGSKTLEDVKKLEEDLGPLPPDWEIAFTEQGDMYYIE